MDIVYSANLTQMPVAEKEMTMANTIIFNLVDGQKAAEALDHTHCMLTQLYFTHILLLKNNILLDQSRRQVDWHVFM